MLELLKTEIFWSATSAVATVAGVAAIFFAIRQLRFEAWLRAMEIFMAREFTVARGLIFARADHDEVEWRDDEKKAGLDVCRRMDEFARLIPHLPKKTALDVWGVPFAKAWLILAPLVDQERAKCRWPTKWDAFESLGRDALRRHPEVHTRT